jgi:hypothetical protein
LARPAVAARIDQPRGEVVAVFVLDIAPDGAVIGVYAVINPDKLTHVS